MDVELDYFVARAVAGVLDVNRSGMAGVDAEI
jgi:hypothetical protein